MNNIKFEKHIIEDNKRLIVCLNDYRSFKLNKEEIKKYDYINFYVIRNYDIFDNLLKGKEGDLFIDLNINEELKKYIRVCFR